MILHHVDLIILLSSYANHLINLRFPNKYPEIPAQITTVFYSLLKELLFSLRFQLELPDVISYQVEYNNKEYKDDWQAYKKKFSLVNMMR